MCGVHDWKWNKLEIKQSSLKNKKLTKDRDLVRAHVGVGE